jgi:iron complex outermembrane recepter protein
MHPFSLRSALILLLLATAARGATPPSAAAPPAPPAPAHAHAEPILLDQFVTSAAPFGRNQIDLAQATTVLSGRHLLLRQQASIGETVAAETGMSATSFGPAASRPIIRGLGGDRIRLLENSIGTLDASIVSPDHAVAIEPLLVERIEVVRGPAALLYGSSAVGGVVNAITHRIETELPTQRSRAAAELRYNSV